MARKESAKRIFIPYESEKKDPSVLSIVVWMCIPVPPFAQIIGLGLLAKKLKNVWGRKKLSDYRNYATVIGSRVVVDVNEISAKMGKSSATVTADLQAMIDRGYLGEEAYIDRGKNVLVLEAIDEELLNAEWKTMRKRRGRHASAEFNIDVDSVREAVSKVCERVIPVGEAVARGVKDAVEKSMRDARVVHVDQAEEEAEAMDAEEPTVDSTAGGYETENVWQEDRFESMLRQIRALNDEIDDEGVSQRIDRIGGLTASIFAVLREKPERANEVQKFMNYYLPTTFKLLKTYSLMEKQSYQGENITASRKKIEDILDTLIAAFEQQQDRLFCTEAMDVEADIQVLETMMAKDGLVYPKGANLRAVSGKGK